MVGPVHDPAPALGIPEVKPSGRRENPVTHLQRTQQIRVVAQYEPLHISKLNSEVQNPCGSKEFMKGVPL